MNSDELVPKLVRACLDNDRKLVEEIATMLVKLYKKSNLILLRKFLNL